MVLEDASHSHGARYKGRKTGSLGHMAAFSFYPGKNLGAYGDGGAVTTSDSELDQKARVLRYVGQRFKFVHEVIGFQERLDEIQAAILCVKLKRLDEWNQRRRRWASIYDEMLADTPLQLPYVARMSTTSIIPMPRLPRRKRSETGCSRTSWNAASGPSPCTRRWCHFSGAYADMGHREGDFPVSASYARRVLNLPMFETLREDEVRKTAETILAYYDRA